MTETQLIEWMLRIIVGLVGALAGFSLRELYRLRKVVHTLANRVTALSLGLSWAYQKIGLEWPAALDKPAEH